MNLQQLRKLGRKMEGRVQGVTGIDVSAAHYGFGDTSIAATDGTSIGFSKTWLASASKREVKGVLAHELGHVVQGAGSSLSGTQQEAYGDALRSQLGLGSGEGYGSKQESQMARLDDNEFQRLSQQAQNGDINRQWLKGASMAGTDGNGPQVGQGNRMRNTFANTLSKNKIDYQNRGGASALPSLDPASTANYYGQLAGLYAGYQNQLIALKQQRIGARADFASQRAQVNAQKIGDLAATENASIERGVLGSSADLQQRGAVRGAAEAGIQSAKQQKMMTIAGTKIAGQQAGIDYFMGVQGLESQKLAQQQTLLAQQLQNNLIVSGQESQMDVLKQIYKSLSGAMAPTSGGGGNGGGGNGGKTKPGVYTDAQLQQFMTAMEDDYGFQSGPLHSVGPHPQ
jgi:hypothetical protein